MSILITIKNKILKFHLLFVLLSMTCSIGLFAQDPIFTQFYSNPVYLNPAFSGTHHCPRIVSNYRNQWPNFSGDFITTSITYDQYVDALKSGFGIILMSDQIAKTLNSNEASFSYSYHQHITRKFTINFALQGNIYPKICKSIKLNFWRHDTSRRGFVFSTADVITAVPVNLFDFSAGILGYSDRFYVGFATHHLTEPKISLMAGSSSNSILNRRYTAHLGTEITLGSKSVYTEENETFRQVFYLSSKVTISN